MKNQNDLYIGLRAVLIVLLQALIFNKLALLNYINPSVYLLIIFWHPFSKNKIGTLLFAFLFGLVLDLFLQTGALHAGSLVFVMFIREFLVKFSLGMFEIDLKDIDITSESIGKQLTYLSLLTFLHNTFLFTFENMGFKQFGPLLLKIIFSSLFTIFINICILVISRKKQND